MKYAVLFDPSATVVADPPFTNIWHVKVLLVPSVVYDVAYFTCATPPPLSFTCQFVHDVTLVTVPVPLVTVKDFIVGLLYAVMTFVAVTGDAFLYPRLSVTVSENVNVVAVVIGLIVPVADPPLAMIAPDESFTVNSYLLIDAPYVDELPEQLYANDVTFVRL